MENLPLAHRKNLTVDSKGPYAYELQIKKLCFHSKSRITDGRTLEECLPVENYIQ